MQATSLICFKYRWNVLWSIILSISINKTEILSHCFFLIMFCLVAYLYKMEEVLALIWSSGLIIMIMR